MNRTGPPLHNNRPHVVTFASGKGGTGKSTICADIARALARYDFRVLCLDAAWSCPSLNILLGCEEPHFDLSGDDGPGIGSADSHVAEYIVPTEHESVYLMSLATARRHPFTAPALHADELLAQLHQLDFDWVLVDLSERLSELDVGLFTLSDIPIVVPTPEPAAIRLVTQFLRAVVFRAIGYHPEAASLEAEILDVLYNQPLHLNARRLRYDAPSADCRAIIDEALDRLETYMIINQVREGAEHDLGFVFCHALHRELQIFPRVLASIEYADRRWFYNRRNTGTDQQRNGEGLSNDMELLARNIRDIELVDRRYPRPIPSPDQEAHPARLMGLNPELSRNEVRQYCRRLWEGYRRENAISLVFGDHERRERIAEELEKLYRHVLTMPSENFTRDSVDKFSRRYAPPSNPGGDDSEQSQSDTDTSPDAAEEHSDADSAASTPDTDTPSRGLTEISDATPPGDSPGERLAELRRDRSLSLQELSSRTHIGVKYLAAIEQIDVDVLPRRVYLRGYLREIARLFEVDAEQLIDDYFAYLERS